VAVIPYRSKRQVKKFFAMEARGELPKGTAEKWSEETPSIKNLPEKAGGKMPRKKGAKALAQTAAQAYEKVKAKTKPGEGGRFKALTKAVEAKGAKTPEALAAWIGRKKYGKAGISEMAAAGRRKK